MVFNLYRLCLAAFVVLVSSCSSEPVKPQNLAEAYGFSAEQIGALEALQTATGANLDLRSKKESSEDFVEAIKNFVKESQSKFVRREGGKERWEVESSKIMSSTELEEACNTLNVFSEISPVGASFNIGILGALNSTMKKRIDYAQTLKASTVILISGERYAVIDKDGSINELTRIANEQGVQVSQVTETHLLKDLYRHSKIPDTKPVLHVIDTPKESLPRPTTETTLMDVAKLLKNHPEITNITFVSNQPYVLYQKEIITAVLKHEGVIIPFDVVGPEASKNIKAQDMIGSVGSYIWAMTPRVLEFVDFSKVSDKTKQELLAFYEKNPILLSKLKTMMGLQN
jgi:hypothetical protein